MSDDVIKLDRIDRAILNELMVNSRITMMELGQKVGLSKTPVTSRVKRLETNGVITGYYIGLSASRLGLEHVAYIEVKLANTQEKALSEFNQAIREIPSVEECHLIAGGFDYLVKVRTRDIKAYRKVLSEQVSNLPYIASTKTYISMESVKDRGVDQL